MAEQNALFAEELTPEQQVLAEIREVLNHGAFVRLEFGFAFSGSGTQESVQVWSKKVDSTRWSKVGPFLTTPGNTRAALLELLAAVMKSEPTDA